MKSQQEYMKNVRTIYLFSQFQLNFHSMSFTSDFRMLISQQSSTTPVRPAKSINAKTEMFYVRLEVGYAFRKTQSAELQEQ